MIQHHKHLSLDLLLPDGFASSAPGAEPAVEARSDSFSTGGRSRPVARRACSTDVLDELERGQRQLVVDGRAALVRLTPTGIEWTSAQHRAAGQAAATHFIPFSEMLSARKAVPGAACCPLPCLRVRLHRLEIATFRRSPARRCEWAPRRVVVEAADEESVEDLAAAIGAGIQAASAGRPRSLLVLLNPRSGYRQARRLYRRTVAPAFAAAGIKACVRETRGTGHARDIVARLDAQQVAGIDGIVCVGGDGVFHEAVNGMLEARGAAAAAGAHALAAALAALRLAHIPAGSTDAVACTLHGTRGAFAAAVHVCLGDSLPLDVLRVDTAAGATFACCIAAYGFLADVTSAAERYRWLGPLRYDLLGAVKLLASRAYPARIRYLEGEVGRALSRQQHAAACTAGCALCRTASFMHSQRGQAAAAAGGSPHAPPGLAAAPAASSTSLSGTVPSEPQSPGRPAVAAAAAAAAAAEIVGSPRPPPPAPLHFLQHAAGAAERHGGEGEAWREVEGSFCSIMLVVMPCRSDKTRSGMARHAHLADGRLKLVLVSKCSPLQYLRFLLAMSRHGCAPGQLPYVQVLDAAAVEVEPAGGGPASCWNLDGEIVGGGDARLAAEVHHGLLRVFARGVE